MNITKTIKNIALGAVLYAAAVFSGGCAKLGFNAVEAAVKSDGDSRVRALNNVDVDLGSLTAGYHGLNEISNLDSDTYFGNHNVTAGRKGSRRSGVVRVLTGSDGVIDTKVGIRDSGIMKGLGGYGRLDVLANADGANVTAFYGRGIGKGFSLELYLSTDIPFDGKPGCYTEVQLNKKLGKHTDAFVRAEIPNFDVGVGQYLLGLTFRK